MKWLQLTESDNKPVWINFDRVNKIDTVMDGREVIHTRLHFDGHDMYSFAYVRENPADIIAQLKMQEVEL